MLDLQNLVSGYPRSTGQVVGGVTLSLTPGSFVCVIGRNGAGKSTLMRTIAGLQPAISGHTSLNGYVVSDLNARDRARAVSVVTTDRVSSPGLFAKDVVELGRQPYTDWRGTLTPSDLDVVADAMRFTSATKFASKLFDSLSDGERQRVMIARAVAQSSQLMVLDEITAFLDLPGRVEVMALLRRHAVETGKIVLLSSHDLELSLELAGDLWIVDDGQLLFGTPEDLVANGAIARAFNGNDVAFDSVKRRFLLREPGRPQAST